ncbi:MULTISPECIES: helix-turn-helix transcriptional regulator [unclassified Rathayibacter]|uniref:helix-turn-helix transcriptional regulator n=1 Tax=unclassified Rathayibacter TaxID=2609250 RepID=UPI0006FFC572|nr:MULTISPECIES: WYL domain-containing protein [unclassified Rathayibacter]KQQ05775.1 transcriptional regulator [Rathayibacter sp. Leaf294]KQS13633.1 transcriptional regulator [Rathayibacter sp. Leaf185]
MTSPSSRMLELLSLLQVRREWAGEVLAERLEVSPRTVRRDVDRLRDLGYRIDAARGPAGGYRLAAGSELPPLLFDDEQAVAVALALAVAPASGADIAEAATRALATVRQVMPARLRHRVDAVQVVAASGRDTVDPEVLVAVSAAVRDRQVLRFHYATPETEARPALRVHPSAVVARAGRWYLLAWAPDREDWRTYRVDRIRPGDPTRMSFTPRQIPGGDPAAFVESRFRGGDGIGGWPCIGTAELDVPAGVLQPYLAADDVLEPLESERCRLTAGSWSWNALAARFAATGAPFRISGPPELRSAAVDLARRLDAS